MPLKHGVSQEVVSHNIHEMVKAGHPLKQAVAASMAMKRKSKKMSADGMYSEGGMVDPDNDEGEGTNDSEPVLRSLNEIQVQGDMNPADVENPGLEEHSDMLAKALYKKAQNEEMMPYAMGGLVQPELHDEALGTKPSEDMADSTEEPMSAEPAKPADEEYAESGLSEKAKKALEEKKRLRKYGMVSFST